MVVDWVASYWMTAWGGGSVGVEPLARVIRSAVREALLGRFVEREVEELILGGVFIEDWGERETPLHQDTPSALKEALRKAGLACELYYSRDGVPAYVANCVTDSGRRVALGLDVSLRDNYDPDIFLFPYMGLVRQRSDPSHPTMGPFYSLIWDYRKCNRGNRKRKQPLSIPLYGIYPRLLLR